MSGNVWEWTQTLWGRDPEKLVFNYPYDPIDGREKVAAGEDVLRVLRGGSFGDNAGGVRCAARYMSSPRSGYWHIGFRVVLAPEIPSVL